jgi:hypothetical protein
MPIRNRVPTSVPAGNAPAHGRRKRRRGRFNSGAWHGILRAAVRADEAERGEPPDLDEDDVLAWADAFFERTGDWPKAESGPIPEAPGETWLLVSAALALGLRGFRRGGSIPRFLNEHRGRYNRADQRFAVGQILAWADDWHERTGDWPQAPSGKIPGAGGVKWSIVDDSLRTGRGVMPGGSSLSRLLFSERGVDRRPPLAEEQILTWVDAHRERTGRWPNQHSGPILDEPDETWAAVNSALSKGLRSFPGGSSLPQLLARRRGVRSSRHAPRLTIPLVLASADAFHARTGKWPYRGSGPIPEIPGETWQWVDSALSKGLRGLPGGSSLTRLLMDRRGIRSAAHAPRLSIPQILAWADAFHARTDQWPTQDAESVDLPPGESWSIIQYALVEGLRGLSRGSSLGRLLAQERGATSHRVLAVPEIIQWADAHHERTGTWPNSTSGPIPEASGETWKRVHGALKGGHRGLPGGSSLVKLLSDERGARCSTALDLKRGPNLKSLKPDLTIQQVLAWADEFHAHTGRWPAVGSGPIEKSPGENWSAINDALRSGSRGLPGDQSLVRLLEQERGAHNRSNQPRMTIEEILGWADAHHDRHGSWPRHGSGPIPEAPGETWQRVCGALRDGLRGLPGGTILFQLLHKERGVPLVQKRVPFTIDGILAWADAHFARTGKWPGNGSGEIPESPGDTWEKVRNALRHGKRGLERGPSLTELLAEKRGRRDAHRRPDLTIPQILAWADAFHAQHGQWPTLKSGHIPESPGESWHSVEGALRNGKRGLGGGSSVACLLEEKRALRNRMRPPELTIPQILSWADAFQARNGRWPNPNSGPIPEAPGETWWAVKTALTTGQRGLPGGLSLRQLRDQNRPPKQRKPRFVFGSEPAPASRGSDRVRVHANAGLQASSGAAPTANNQPL